MKNKASAFVKQIITALAAMARAKTLALKSKTRALKARLVIFSLVRNRKILMSSFSRKLNALTGRDDHKKAKLEEEEEDAAEKSDNEDEKKPAVVYSHNAMSTESLPAQTYTEIEEEDDKDGDGDDDASDKNKYPDLTHSLFDEFEDPGGSVIDIVKHSKEDKGEEFKLEDEIDRVADLFIKRFHRQMWMQKQLSFKNYSRDA